MYGMPAYAKDGEVVCFFQSAQKFKSRYATLGFSDTANLDEDAMWPTSFALRELTATKEVRDALKARWTEFNKTIEDTLYPHSRLGLHSMARHSKRISPTTWFYVGVTRFVSSLLGGVSKMMSVDPFGF